MSSKVQQSSPYGESLVSRATDSNLGLLYDPNGVDSFSANGWNVGTNPDLAFARFGQDNRLPVRRALRNYSGLHTYPLS